MAGLFNAIGWIVIIVGFAAGFFTAFISVTAVAGIGLLASLGILGGSLLIAAPFFAISEIMNRLERLQALQSRANEIHTDILAAIVGKAV